MTTEWEFKYHHMLLLGKHRPFFSLFTGRQLNAHSLYRLWHVHPNKQVHCASGGAFVHV